MRLSPPKDDYSVQRIKESWYTRTIRYTQTIRYTRTIQYTRTTGFHSTRNKNETIHLQKNGDYYVKQNQPASEVQILQVPPSNVDSISTFLCVRHNKRKYAVSERKLRSWGGGQERKEGNGIQVRAGGVYLRAARNSVRGQRAG